MATETSTQQEEAVRIIQLAESRWQAATKAITEVDQRMPQIPQERDEAKRKAANATATIRRRQIKEVAKEKTRTTKSP